MKKKKTNKVLRVLKGLFDRAERKRKVKAKQVKAVIDNLKKRERSIKKRLEGKEPKSKIKQLTNERDVIRAQRKKGQKLLRDLRKQR